MALTTLQLALGATENLPDPALSKEDASVLGPG